MFRHPDQELDSKHESSPVSEADIAVDRLLHERLTADAGLRLAVGRKRRRSCAARAALRLDRRSDRRHPRLSRGLPDWTVSAALVDNGRPVVACLLRAGDGRIFYGDRGQGATPQRRSDRGDGRGVACGRAGRRAEEPILERLADVAPPFTVMPRDPLACAAPCPRRARRVRRRDCRRTTATTGTLRRPTFWCTKRAAR